MLPIADQKTVSVSNPCSGNGYHTRGNCHSVARWSEQSGVISLRLRRDSMLRSWEWKFLCLSPKHIFLSFLLSWGDQILLKLSKPVLSSSSWPSTCCCSPALMVRKKGPGQSRFGVEKRIFSQCVWAWQRISEPLCSGQSKGMQHELVVFGCYKASVAGAPTSYLNGTIQIKLANDAKGIRQ